MQCEILDWTLKLMEDISKKTGKIQRKAEINN